MFFAGGILRRSVMGARDLKVRFFLASSIVLLGFLLENTSENNPASRICCAIGDIFEPLRLCVLLRYRRTTEICPIVVRVSLRI